MLHLEFSPLSSVTAVIVGGLLGVGCAKNGDDAQAGSPASSTTTTSASSASSAPLAVCNSLQNDGCTEIFSFGPLGADAEKKSCEAGNGVYTTGASCATDRALVGICAHSRAPGELQKKVYAYEVAFDKGNNRVQARGFAKSTCDGVSATWTDADPAGTRDVKPAVNQVVPTHALYMKEPS